MSCTLHSSLLIIVCICFSSSDMSRDLHSPPARRSTPPLAHRRQAIRVQGMHPPLCKKVRPQMPHLLSLLLHLPTLPLIKSYHLPSFHPTKLANTDLPSDLLSRHVNKAHRAAEAGAEPKKESKKGRRKSLPSSARQATDESSGSGEGSGQATQHQVSNGGPAASDSTNEAARRASFSQAPHLQAQALFPHHPLLAGTPSPLFVNTAGVNGVMGSPVNSYHPSVLGGPAATVNGFHHSMASPMTWSNSDMGASSSSMTRNESSLSSYDYGLKKKACDQCNHSKQRCDFAHPCGESFLAYSAYLPC